MVKNYVRNALILLELPLLLFSGKSLYTHMYIPFMILGLAVIQLFTYGVCPGEGVYRA